MSVAGNGVTGEERRFTDMNLYMKTAVVNGNTLSGTELGYVDGVTAGTAAASKALVLDATKELAWTITDSATDQVTPVSCNTTASGAGASVDGWQLTTTTAVALGTYANVLNGKLDFGSAGSVTGLGGAICAELDQGAGTTSGSYACFEAEYVGGTSASTGTRTSFLSLNASGTLTNFNANAFLFDLNGISAGASNMFASNAKSAIGMTHTLKCQVLGATYYIALHTSANFGGS